MFHAVHKVCIRIPGFQPQFMFIGYYSGAQTEVGGVGLEHATY